VRAFTVPLFAEPLLAGVEVMAPETPSSAVAQCVRHLRLLGATPNLHSSGGITRDTVHIRTGDGDNVAAAIEWPPSAPDTGGARWREMTLQATSGLMAVHGWDAGRPRRLGLGVVSSAAGTLTSAALLAALVARGRGVDVRSVATRAPGAAMLLLAHHLAGATCGDAWTAPAGGSAPGPPFATADGEWVELEVLDPERWKEFWGRLGVEGRELGPAWLAFAFRHSTARCTLPQSLHDATARCTLRELRGVADACRVSLVRVRGYDEVRREWRAGVPPWQLFSAPPTTPVADGAAQPAPRGAGAPLAGVQVVEATSRIQGPMAGRMLALLGADVVRVEPPGGDLARDAPPTAGTVGAGFVTYNHGKECVELDYKSQAGRADLLDLIAGADVFLHNWPFGRADEVRLSEDELLPLFPQLVYAHASGWGHDADRSLPALATDFLVQAHAACGAGLNPLDEQPVPSRLTIVDMMGGLVAAEAMLAGLVLPARTGYGCSVGTSLLGAALDMQEPVLSAMSCGHEGRSCCRPRWDPLERPMATQDGFLVVDVADEQSRRRVAGVCGVAADDDSAIAAAFRSQPAAAWSARLADAGVASAPVRTDLATLPADTTFAPVIEDIEGVCALPASPWRFQ
jgi:crotonobetainyl-CoA:carnitine CoA-transferase CaiB-like acyl-CoA transferase